MQRHLVLRACSQALVSTYNCVSCCSFQKIAFDMPTALGHGPLGLWMYDSIQTPQREDEKGRLREEPLDDGISCGCSEAENAERKHLEDYWRAHPVEVLQQQSRNFTLVEDSD